MILTKLIIIDEERITCALDVIFIIFVEQIEHAQKIAHYYFLFHFLSGKVLLSLNVHDA